MIKGLCRIFAEAANIPSAVAYLPTVPFANSRNQGFLEITGAAVAGVALAFGLAAMPATALTVATPLYIVGRLMQGLTQDNTLMHRLFKLDR